MSRKSLALPVVCLMACCCVAEASPPSPTAASSVWNSLAAPVMDPAKFAQLDNIVIVRDRVRITFTGGTIQFVQAVNGIVFAAVFHGNGRIQAAPPTPAEAQQLRLFTKQDKLDLSFSDATFTFSDTFFDEIAAQAKWQPSGPASDELYVRRQTAREDLGAEYLPRLFKSIQSADRRRTSYFLADSRLRKRVG